jgi:hypothetical protein
LLFQVEATTPSMARRSGSLAASDRRRTAPP